MERKGNGFLKFLMALAIIGAINWGLIGFFNFNLVNAIFGGPTSMGMSTLSRIIYALVGLAGLGAALLYPARHRDRVGHTRTHTHRVGGGDRVPVT